MQIHITDHRTPELCYCKGTAGKQIVGLHRIANGIITPNSHFTDKFHIVIVDQVNMIECSNTDCDNVQWFHLACVGDTTTSK